MKKLAVIALVFVMGLAFAIPAAAESNQNYIGRWLATDVYDGSNMELWITHSVWTGGRLLILQARDDITGPWCGGEARMEAIGVLVADNSFEASGAWVCINPVENYIFPIAWSYTYDPVNDTIEDDKGNTWHRAPDLPPTYMPVIMVD